MGSCNNYWWCLTLYLSFPPAIAMCRMHFVSRPEDAAARPLHGVKVVGRPRSKHSDTHWKALGLKVRKKGIVQKGKTHFGWYQPWSQVEEKVEFLELWCPQIDDTILLLMGVALKRCPNLMQLRMTSDQQGSEVGGKFMTSFFQLVRQFRTLTWRLGNYSSSLLVCGVVHIFLCIPAGNCI